MHRHTRIALGAVFVFALLAGAPRAHAQDSDTVSMAHDPARYQIVVSATRTPTRVSELPNSAVVVTGAELRRRGARTLADALIDVVGVEAGGGSDNGSHLTNIGMWGLKEFDALLITVDGVPVGGPFNPSLVQIAVDDIDHIEVVKGPQGTMYGVSAFAGMIQVFTSGNTHEGVSATVGGGSFGDVHGRAAMHHGAGNWNLDAVISGGRADGYQDRTGSQFERGRVALSGALGHTKLAFDLTGLSDRQEWGTPVPFDAGEPLPGFKPDYNNAPIGAAADHGVWSLASRLSAPLWKQTTLRNVISVTRDRQTSIRSFMTSVDGDTAVGSEGVELRPVETVFFDDLNLLTTFQLGGAHELVTGAAITWGRTKATGIGFDFDQIQGDVSSIPSWDGVPVGDNRAFLDRRTFYGVYAHDSWTPVRALTIEGGGRWDHAEEKLHAFGQEVGDVAAISDDAKTSEAWSGDVSALVRLLPENSTGDFSALNLYGNFKSSFKPAAPNLTEAEDAEILDPERTHSLEGGLKGELWEGQLGFDASIFQLDFHNLVVGNFNEDGDPIEINAGQERFKGYEVSATIAPSRLRGFSLSGGYAHHDPRFVQFTFFTPDGTFRDVSGKFVELAPRELYNARAAFAPGTGLGGWVALRHQGQRALTRRNSFFTPAFDEYDAGLSLDTSKFRVTAQCRNLGDDRHPVSESDIGDSMFYISAPRRYSGEVSFKF